MGEVRLAQDPVLRRLVALKLIRSETIAEGGHVEAKERLLREAQAMATLAHPNVVAVYDAGIHEGEVFLAMEYVEGMTLSAWLATKPPWREVMARFLDAGRGLVAAHEAGILHRDFKPNNVFVSRDGRVRVGDFGLSSVQGVAAPPPGTDSGPLTVAGAILGTPAYMSPEQIHGQPVDARSDQFSFCVALHEALFGVRPFEAATLDETRWMMMQGRKHPVKDMRAVPAVVLRALERGLAILPAARYASMRELCAALESAASGEIHIRIHFWCQTIFALMHFVVATAFTYNVYVKPEDVPSATSSSSSSSSGDAGGYLWFMPFLFWIMVVLAFLYSGPFWALLNAIGLAGRRRWARVSTILYAIVGLSSCIGAPYAAYTLWSLRRQEVKASLWR
jgi:serine/threonine protein kinase